MKTTKDVATSAGIGALQVMAYIVMACIVRAYIVMAYTLLASAPCRSCVAYIVMACIVRADKDIWLWPA